MSYINPTGPVSKPRGPVTARLDRSSAGGENPPPRPPAHVAAPELAKYRELLRDLPEIREERIREVSRRLQSGYYLSAEAAEETARRLLEHLDAQL